MEAPRTSEAQPPGPPIEYSGEEYLEEALLTAPPRPMDPPRLSGTALLAAGSQAIVQLVVYVDEHGRVHRAEAEQDDVPPDLLTALQAALEASRFTPGRLDSTPVKAVVHLQATITGAAVELSPRR